jgi:hypothetical protein
MVKTFPFHLLPATPGGNTIASSLGISETTYGSTKNTYVHTHSFSIFYIHGNMLYTLFCALLYLLSQMQIWALVFL